MGSIPIGDILGDPLRDHLEDPLGDPLEQLPGGSPIWILEAGLEAFVGWLRGPRVPSSLSKALSKATANS